MLQENNVEVILSGHVHRDLIYHLNENGLKTTLIYTIRNKLPYLKIEAVSRSYILHHYLLSKNVLIFFKSIHAWFFNCGVRSNAAG